MNILQTYLLAAKISFATIFCCAIFFSGYHSGKKNMQLKWDSEKITTAMNQDRAVLNAVAKNEIEHKIDVKKSAEVIKNYESTITTKNAQITAARAAINANKLLINRASICGGAPATGETTGSIIFDAEGASSNVELPAALASSLRDIAEDADREIANKNAKIEGLQQWAIDHEFSN